ncbi:MAG: 5'/3'-nucleotidase SurE [Oceanospirillaceae bacterium]|nr:5'/3'-nucleotidase SurE [Oceanospirillaceae bacterium]
MMQILVSNDDGVTAPGLKALAEQLKTIAKVQVIAPDRNRSAASNALTLDKPLSSYVHSNGYISIDGTPTDCVNLGVAGIFGITPDVIVSGINAGANLGDDVLYSGTVAAAMEGRTLGLPGIAISVVNAHPNHYASAAIVARDLVRKLKSLNVAPRTVLNVNVPDLPIEQIKGIHVTRLGHRAVSQSPVECTDPRGVVRHWIAGVGSAIDNGPGTDFYAIEQGFVSITPVHFDMTHYAVMNNLEDWLENI